VLTQAAAAATGVVRKKQGDAVNDSITPEERAEWTERTRLEALCAYFTSQIYSGAIEMEGYDVIRTDPEPTSWKAGMIILRHDASSSLFVVFRGTADIKDVVSDVNIASVAPYPDRSVGGLRVFGGAWNHTCSRALDDIVPAVKDALARGIENIIFTGHSLGGACALLARFYMQTAMHGLKIPDSVRMRSMGFGAPIVFAHPESELPEEAAQVMAVMERDAVTFVNGKVLPCARRSKFLPASPLLTRSLALSHTRSRTLFLSRKLDSRPRYAKARTSHLPTSHLALIPFPIS
jgi:hypothetical protein